MPGHRVALIVLLLAASPPVLAGRPNVVLIVADDLGYADVGFNGCQDIPTPAIDRLAAEGVRLSNGYVTFAVCSPSRAGMITGRHQQRFGYERNPIYNPLDPQSGLPLEESTLADALGSVGYTSTVLGKWHLGAHDRFHPLNRGFDEFYGFLTGGHDYFPEKWIRRGGGFHWEGYQTKLMRGREFVEESEYLTDALSREACDFVRRQKDGPFFLYLAYNAPHTPMQAPRAVIERFAGIEDRTRRVYAAMVSIMDAGIGRVLDTLNELELEEETLVFFLSDNGGATNNGSSNTPLRGHKGSVYEGGLRVPFVARWTGTLGTGVEYSEPVSALDIFATAATHAGALGSIDPSRPIDGVDLVPYLTGEASGPPHEALFWRDSGKGSSAARAGGMKLARENRDAADALYDLDADLGEQTDLSPARSDELKRLRKAWEAWNRELIDPVFVGLESIKTYRQEWGF